MDIDTVLIKTEPKYELISVDGSNTSPNFVKDEVSPTIFNNEEFCTSTKSFDCKSEHIDSYNNVQTALKPSQMEMDDIFDEEDRVDISKLRQLLNQENEKYDPNSFVGKALNIKKEDEEDDPLQISESKNFSSEGEILQKVQVKCDASVKEEISVNEDNKLIFKSEQDNENERACVPPDDIKQRDEKINKTKGKKFHCGFCSYQTIRQSHLDRHFNSMHNDRRSKIDCLYCDKSFVLKYSLKEHLLNHHKDKIGSEMKELTTIKTHTCDFCTYKTTRKHSLDAHVNSIHNKQRVKNKCQFCDKLFAYKRSLNDHLLKKHKEKINKTDIKVHQCYICPYHTTHKGALNYHVNSVHNEQRAQINCQFCAKSFAIPCSHEDHLLKHHEEEIKSDVQSFITSKILICEFCSSYKTIKRQCLNKHINLMHNEQRTKNNCKFCDRQFRNKTSVDDHLLKHHKKEMEIDSQTMVTSKIHKCDTCAYETTVKRNMLRHICKAQ